ncbi:hypothetical protein PITCH_A2030227 [uncultured Desulfobacterium sp.]|uniref:Uncharacterized protein n=1 Tax=uncultured Desulfobacterium sp. TaxID=201089 RepID=A0A445MXC9_9BACT|nr:hypothetical protein PITCH_A2030227 [uncultured Desulfobacterium sp.]
MIQGINMINICVHTKIKAVVFKRCVHIIEHAFNPPVFINLIAQPNPNGEFIVKILIPLKKISTN